MYTITDIEILTNRRLELTFIACPECQKAHKLTVSQDEFENWICGGTLEEAFPLMSIPDRELFLTGIDGGCWKKIFAKGEEEEDAADQAL